MKTVRSIAVVGLSLALGATVAAQDAPSKPAPPPSAPAAPKAPPSRPSKPATPPAAPGMPVMPSGPEAPQVTPVDNAPAPKELWAKHIEAIGGESNLPTEGSQTTKGRLIVPAVGMEGTVSSFVRAPNKLLTLVDLKQIGLTQKGFDGTTGWAIEPMTGARLIEGEELELMLIAADMRGYAVLADRAKEMKTLGKATFDGTETWVVETKGAITPDVTCYFETDSGLLRGMRLLAPTPYGKMPFEFAFTDYKQFGKLKFAAMTTTRAMSQEFKITTEEVSNADVPLSTFEIPPEAKVLADAKKQGGATAPSTPPKGPGAAPKAPAAPKDPAAPPSKPSAPKDPAGTRPPG